MSPQKFLTVRPFSAWLFSALSDVACLLANLTIGGLSEDQAAAHACGRCLKDTVLKEVLTVAIIVIALLWISLWGHSCYR